MKYLISMSLLLCVVCFAFTYKQPRAITGKVTDDQSNPAVGVSVIVKGTQTGTATNAQGEYTITVQSDKAVLVFSWVGYKTKELKITTSNTLNVILKPLEQALQEVVVTTAYGIKMKKELGYSTTSIQSGPIAYDATGANTDIRIRGKTSVTADYIPQLNEIKNDTEEPDNFNTEGYDKITDNPFLKVNDNPLSTFSIDVDAASYSNVRRFINSGQLPPAGAVRIEEMINYFAYKYPQPTDDAPFSINTEMTACPWNDKHELVLVGLQGKKIETANLPASNLVFLIDVSGSMDEQNKLPLVQASLKLLVDQLREQDHVALVVYAGNAGLVLPSTSGENKTTIKDAIDKLQAGGSTAGGAGIQLAYKTAKENFAKDGNNRVILCTDGDFNIGLSSDDALETMIEQERKSGVFLTVLGYGMGNYQDSKMQKLADKGNGNHAYIDGISEAKKVLVNEFGGTLFTIAKDVKLQIEFNPAKVQSYRLIGYENRMLAKEDFNNDLKDAGELGSGHTVTALYEIVPVGVQDDLTDSVDPLRYQQTKKVKTKNDFGSEVMNIKLRYKKPDGDESKLLQYPLADNIIALNKTTDNFRFAAAVAGFGMLLRNSDYKGNSNFEMVQQLAKQSLGDDTEGYRKAFLQMVAKASLLKTKKELTTVE